MKVRLADGPKMWMPLDRLREADPHLVIDYVFKHGLEHDDGYKWVHEYLKHDEDCIQMVRTHKTATETTKKYKFGVEVPRNAKHAMELDKANGNTGWRDATQLELKQINDYGVFRVVPDGQPMPKGYKRIPYHLVYDVKFDGRLKGRLVAGGHRTPFVPKEESFSGVVTNEAVRLGFMMARLKAP